MASFRLMKNVAIMGPPGSGKGFYGRPLAAHLGVKLYTASDILRQHGPPDLDLTSGKLVDCATVSKILRKFFMYQASRKVSRHEGRHFRHYIVDGFPRSRQQIIFMERYWPIKTQVHYALHLDVPDEVCTRKMLGRRRCSKCLREYNVADVNTPDGFVLPPQLPTDEDKRRYCDVEKCDPDRDWTTREDDVPDIVTERLRLYREQEKPVVNFYKKENRLLRFTPYRGELDIPKLVWTTTDWLRKHQ